MAGGYSFDSTATSTTTQNQQYTGGGITGNTINFAPAFGGNMPGTLAQIPTVTILMVCAAILGGIYFLSRK